MDRSELRVREQCDQICLCGFLDGFECCALESKLMVVAADFKRDLSDQLHKWPFSEEEVCRFLQSAYLSQCRD
jgi:hypothetical protein